MQLNSLTDLRVWIGLKNSDDQGTYFDLKAELRKNGSVIATGETKNIQGVTRNASQAKEVTLAFGAISNSQFAAGDVLSIRILTKVADSGGHNNATGLRLYYDAVSRQSRFGATFGASAPPLQVTITAPPPGAVIQSFSVLVRGQIANIPAAQNLGVTVSGVGTIVSGNEFTTVVPVDPTITSLTALAVNFSGTTLASDTIPVTVLAPTTETVVRLIPSPPGGLAPLAVGFSLSTLVPVSQIALDLDGNGSADFQGTSLTGQLFTYNQPGLFTPTVQITDSQGQTYTASSFVQVLDQAALDGQLQAVWQGFKNALRAGDISQAVSFLHSESRAAYQAKLAQFNATTLANIDQYLTSIQLVEAGFGGAQYEMIRNQGGQAVSFSVWFRIDQDGLWRIRRF